MTGWYSSSWKARSLEYGEGGGFPPPFSYATKQSGGDKTHRPPDTAARLRPTKQPVCFTTERAVCDNRIIHFLSTLPDHFDVEVGDRKFHLVHAMPSDDPDDRIWRRPKPDDPPYFEDRIAVVGHTPTCYMSGDMESPFAIWHGNGLIDIDCGCGNKTELRRLACLRLDDLKEFYI